MNDILTMSLHHLLLASAGVFYAVIAGIPLGYLAFRHPWFRAVIIPFSEWLQIFPTMALLALLLFIWGLSDATLIATLFLYSLLPIVSAVQTGLDSIRPEIREAAKGMGMNRFQFFCHIQFPLSFPHFLGGIRMALVTAIGITTIGVLVGAGGLGQPIWRGIQTQNTPMILSGAIPTAFLAIGIDWVGHWLERKVMPWRQDLE